MCVCLFFLLTLQAVQVNFGSNYIHFLISLPLNIPGIGRGIAVELWRCGAQVVAVSRTKSHLESLQREYPSIQTLALDLGDWAQARDAIEGLGCFDALVNNAALGLTEDFLTTTPENFDM